MWPAVREVERSEKKNSNLLIYFLFIRLFISSSLTLFSLHKSKLLNYTYMYMYSAQAQRARGARFMAMDAAQFCANRSIPGTYFTKLSTNLMIYLIFDS